MSTNEKHFTEGQSPDEIQEPGVYLMWRTDDEKLESITNTLAPVVKVVRMHTPHGEVVPHVMFGPNSRDWQDCRTLDPEVRFFGPLKIS